MARTHFYLLFWLQDTSGLINIFSRLLPVTKTKDNTEEATQKLRGLDIMRMLFQMLQMAIHYNYTFQW